MPYRGGGAAGAVLCLAFPVASARTAGEEPARRADGVTEPVLVIQGEADAFGMPPAGLDREVAVVPGTHSLARGLSGMIKAARAWLAGMA